jgi:hypothetical protein
MSDHRDTETTDTSKVTRIEIIDNMGRLFVGYSFSDVQLSVQDDGRTLKVFGKREALK